MKYDIIFIHAPSIFDFREKPILSGPISDVVPSTTMFEMYPVGFVTLSDYLEKKGFRTRIANIAIRMLTQPKFNVERFIQSLDANIFGFDLHWLMHAQGSVELAKLVKKHHPNTPIIFGGLSSTYFHEELIRYPQVDMVMKGDSTEEPMRILLDILKKGGGGDLSQVPNLTWKDRAGVIHSQPITYVPERLTDSHINYARVIKSAIRNRDIRSYLPFKDFLRYPIVALLTCRGCSNNCSICGGSRFAYTKFYNRPNIAMMDPERLAFDIADAASYFAGPVVLVGDLQAGGLEYVDRFLDTLSRYKFKNMVVFEFWDLPPKEFYEKVSKSLSNWSFEISCESQDPIIRRKFGKANYTNEELKQAINDGLNAGAKRADVYLFMGIPFQTRESILEIPEFAEYLYDSLDVEANRLVFLAAPLAPYVDPGSLAFERPSHYGYRIVRRTLAEHIEGMVAPSWKYGLNYESDYIDRDSFVKATYECALRLNEIKRAKGAISKSNAEHVERNIIEAVYIMDKIDEIYNSRLSPQEKEVKYFELKNEMASHSMSTVCEKRELEWSVPALRKFKIRGLIKAMLLK
ncbi:MAG: TIGR04190 family B12-binding domain/radical SAM domain protein [Firmicutes bacterium]|nr:TIGR04190 family B12-binding domain/radical SAM domain protein [Bacillota bacterium]